MNPVAALRVKTRSNRRATFNDYLRSIRKIPPGAAPRPLKIVDIGGTVSFWEDWWQITDSDGLDITLINNHVVDVSARGRRPKHKFISDLNQDATSLRIADLQQYDVVFSNSFFEHLPSREAQASLAAAIVASGVPYFIQVPNKYSPVDPHFPYGPPFFAAYPKSVRIRLRTLSSFGSGWRAPSVAAARQAAQFYNPLSLRDMRELFPAATIAVERLLLIPMSILAYWNGH